MFNFIVDSKHRLSKRAAMVAAIVIGLFFVDNYVGFSDYYAYQNKIDQVTKIEALLRQPNLDSVTRKQLRIAENQLLARRSWAGQLPSLMSLMTSATSSKTSQKISPSSGKIIVTQKNDVKRNLYWHVATSTWPIFVMIVGLMFVPFADKRIEGAAIVTAVIAIGFLLGVAYLFSLLFLQIPVLFGMPVLNYILNALISFGLALGVMAWSGAFRKSSNESINVVHTDNSY